MRGGQSNLNVFLLAKSNANNYRDRLSTGYHIRLISPFINSSFGSVEKRWGNFLS